MGKRIEEVGVEELREAGLNFEEANEFEKILKDVLDRTGGSDPKEVWREITARRVLKPKHPHRLHQLVYYTVYGDWDVSTNGPPLYWFPSLLVANALDTTFLKGDAIAIAMPKPVHAVIIYLAIVLAGCVVVSIA